LFPREIEHMTKQPAHGRSQNMHDAQGPGASVAIVEAVLRHFRGASSVLAGAAPRRGESSRAVETAMRAKILCLRC
jgi:hypothetical protein